MNCEAWDRARSFFVEWGACLDLFWWALMQREVSDEYDNVLNKRRIQLFREAERHEENNDNNEGSVPWKRARWMNLRGNCHRKQPGFSPLLYMFSPTAVLWTKPFTPRVTNLFTSTSPSMSMLHVPKPKPIVCMYLNNLLIFFN